MEVLGRGRDSGFERAAPGFALDGREIRARQASLGRNVGQLGEVVHSDDLEAVTSPEFLGDSAEVGDFTPANEIENGREDVPVPLVAEVAGDQVEILGREHVGREDRA
jgi:hypothetical protein